MYKARSFKTMKINNKFRNIQQTEGITAKLSAMIQLCVNKFKLCKQSKWSTIVVQWLGYIIIHFSNLWKCRLFFHSTDSLQKNLWIMFGRSFIKTPTSDQNYYIFCSTFHINTHSGTLQKAEGGVFLLLSPANKHIVPLAGHYVAILHTSLSIMTLPASS